MSGQLLFAEVIVSNERSTYAVLWIFSKPILREFTGEGHQKTAHEWVKSWQAHLDHVWSYTKDVFSKTMNEFATALSSHGVDAVVIGKAFQSLQEDSFIHG